MIATGSRAGSSPYSATTRDELGHTRMPPLMMPLKLGAGVEDCDVAAFAGEEDCDAEAGDAGAYYFI